MSDDWTIVDQAEVAEATKARKVKSARATAAVKALSDLEPGQAIRITLPRETRYEADVARGWWRNKMQKASQNEGVAKAFRSVTSSDGEFLFIQRNRESS